LQAQEPLVLALLTCRDVRADRDAIHRTAYRGKHAESSFPQVTTDYGTDMDNPSIT
jgi:hypothetical protein